MLWITHNNTNKSRTITRIELKAQVTANYNENEIK